MIANKKNSDWVLNYIIAPILLILLIGLSTKIHFLSKSKIDSQDEQLNETENIFVKMPN